MSENTVPADPPEATARKRSGSEKRQRTAGMLVRFTPEEQAHVQAEAREAGLTPPGFARVQILGKPAARAARRPPVEVEHLARILAQIGKIGSNLNQIARAANTNRLAIPDVELLRDETRELQGLRALLMRALGRTP